MVTKDDLKRIALEVPGVVEKQPGSYFFLKDGRNMIWPFPERIHPKKARVPRYDQYLMRVAAADDKMACLEGEPDIFFTNEHYNGYNAVIVRLEAIDEDRLQDLVQIAAAAAPLSTKS